MHRSARKVGTKVHKYICINKTNQQVLWQHRPGRPFMINSMLSLLNRHSSEWASVNLVKLRTIQDSQYAKLQNKLLSSAITAHSTTVEALSRALALATADPLLPLKQSRISKLDLSHLHMKASLSSSNTWMMYFPPKFDEALGLRCCGNLWGSRAEGAALVDVLQGSLHALLGVADHHDFQC